MEVLWSVFCWMSIMSVASPEFKMFSFLSDHHLLNGWLNCKAYYHCHPHFHCQIRPFWKSSVTTLDPFSKLGFDEFISEGNESLFS